MLFRMLGLIVSFAIVGYLLYAVLSSDSKVSKAVNTNPAIQEQQKTLQSMGVDATDKEALKNYAEQQAKQIEEYQNQAPPSE